MEIVDGNTLVKHVMFSDINIIQKIKKTFSHES